jgi:steroid delta-isomerase-like uncharacterized protein
LTNDQNKAIVRKLIDEAFNHGNLKVLDELVGPECILHDPSAPDMGKGPEAARRAVSLYRAAFPDLRVTVEDMLSDGDKVVTRWSARGTHRGAFGAIGPTGKTGVTTGIEIDRLLNGKIVEVWVNWDESGLMRQLGVAPSPMSQPEVVKRK